MLHMLCRLFGGEADSELFCGDAHAVLCEKGKSPEALSYMSVPPLGWFEENGEDRIGVAIPSDIKHRLRKDLKGRVKVWYFRADLPKSVLRGEKEAWENVRIESPEKGVWCLYFPGCCAG